MSKQPQPCPDWLKRPLYWATVAYLRTWWASDGIRVKLIQKEGSLTIETLRSIGVEYNVNRLIPGKKKSEVLSNAHPGISEDKSAWVLCKFLNGACATWPNDLSGRATACLGIVDKARDQKVSTKDLVSATTKFMWFLNPDEWTVFDNFASTGLGINYRLTARDRMQAFYLKLERLGFVPLVKQMQTEINTTTLRGLPATRILDTLLMARGGRGADEMAIRGSQAFMNLLPAETQRPLIEVATSMQTKFGDHVLTHPGQEGLA